MSNNRMYLRCPIDHEEICIGVHWAQNWKPPVLEAEHLGPWFDRLKAFMDKHSWCAAAEYQHEPTAAKDCSSLTRFDLVYEDQSTTVPASASAAPPP